MAKWINRVVLASGGTGSVTETYNPAAGTVVSGAVFTATAGRLLVAVIGGPVTSSTPAGWTLPAGGSAINANGLYVWWKVAAGGDTITSTHNGDGSYPTTVEVLEFPAGSTFVGSAANAATASGAAGPVLSGLTGTNLIMGALTYPGGTSNSWTWNTGVESTDYSRGGSSPKWVELATNYLEDSTLTSASMAATRTAGAATTAERLNFAVKVAATGGTTHTLTGDAVSTSTTTGAARLVLPVTGAAVSVSSTTGAVTITGTGLTGSAVSTSATTGAITVRSALTGSAVSTSATTGEVTARAALTGAAASTSATSGAVSLTVPLTGSAVSVSTTTGAIGARQPLTGSAVSVSSTTGDINLAGGPQTHTLTGSASSVSSTTGTARVVAVLAGSALSVTGTTGALAVALPLTGAALSVSATTGNLTARNDLRGSAVSVSGTAGDVTAVLTLTGTAWSTSSTTGALTVTTGPVEPVDPVRFTITGPAGSPFTITGPTGAGFQVTGPTGSAFTVTGPGRNSR